MPPVKNEEATRNSAVSDEQALLLHGCIAALMYEFRLEPGLLAGSAYADLHANDIGLFEILSGEGDWNVRRIAQRLSAPMTTISSALDRLERKGLIERRRIADDRRVVRIELTARGRRLEERLCKAHVENCRAMLARLSAEHREPFLSLAVQLAGVSKESKAGR